MNDDVVWNPDADPRRQPEQPKVFDFDANKEEYKKLLQAMANVKISMTQAQGALQFLKGSWPEPDDTPAYEKHEMNGRVVRTHRKKYCAGRHCVIHNPSKHGMLTWPRNFRDDTKRTERMCRHGIGHPDPDDVAYWVSQGRSERALQTHGCDGCCTEALKMPALP
jgi:hypothetical protein